MRVAVHDLSDYAREHYQNIELLENNAKNDTVRTEYAMNGLSFHRGYYNPSPIDKLLISNQTQGKPCKSMPKNGYCYRFNNDGRIISVLRFSKGRLTHIEYIVCKDNAEYGLTFSVVNEPYIECAVKTVYENNRPVEFLSLLFPINLTMNIIRYQRYYYDDNELKAADVILDGMYPTLCHFRSFEFETYGEEIRLK